MFHVSTQKSKRALKGPMNHTPANLNQNTCEPYYSNFYQIGKQLMEKEKKSNTWGETQKRNKTYLVIKTKQESRKIQFYLNQKETKLVQFVRLIQVCLFTYAVLSHSVLSNSLGCHGLQPTRTLCPSGFSRQEYWSGLPCPPPVDLLNPGIELRSPTLQMDSLPLSHQGSLLIQILFLNALEGGCGLRVNFNFFMYLFLAVLSLRYYVHFSLVKSSRGFHIVAVSTLLTGVASFVAKHGLEGT